MAPKLTNASPMHNVHTKFMHKLNVLLQCVTNMRNISSSGNSRLFPLYLCIKKRVHSSNERWKCRRRLPWYVKVALIQLHLSQIWVLGENTRSTLNQHSKKPNSPFSPFCVKFSSSRKRAKCTCPFKSHSVTPCFNLVVHPISHTV